MKDKIIRGLNDEANELFNQGQYEKTLRKYDEIIKIKPDYQSAIHDKACCLWEMGKIDEAIKCFDLNLKIKLSSASLYMKAFIFEEQGKLNEALKNCNLASKANDSSDDDVSENVIAVLRKRILLRMVETNVKPIPPKSNKEGLELFLSWAKEFCEKNKLKVGGFKMYNNEFFSTNYLFRLVKDEYIILNKDMGKKPKLVKFDLKNLKISKETIDFIQKSAAEIRVQPWYYIGKGKIFEEDILKKNFKVKNKWTILNRYKQTKKILISQSKIRKEGFQVHDDWWGTYFLELTSLPGKEFHEVKFSTKELYNLRTFIEKERPKGAVLCYITSDKECPIYDINLSPLLNIFDIPELQYLKLLFVSKVKIQKAPIKKSEPEEGVAKYIALPYYDKKVEWVLAYSK